MIIIIEGADATGKDSMINNLSKLTNMEVVRGSSFEMSEKGADKMFEEAKKLLLEEKDLILNRSFYSNAVYGPMYKYPTMTDEQFNELNRIVEEVGVVYYLTADTGVIMDRLNARGDEDIKAEDIKDIQAGYKHMWNRFKPSSLVTIDVTHIDLLDIDSDIYGKILENNRKHNKMKKEEFKSRKNREIR